MKILLDMNLSPDWVGVLAKHDIPSVHWSTVGDPRAEDTEIIEWARINNYVIFTHDLDFGTMLALTGAESPSVIQARTQDVTPAHLETKVLEVLRNHQLLLESGALVILDEGRERVRILPLTR